MIKINPLTLKKWRRFQSIKRGYYSFLFLSFFSFVSIFAELFVNNRAIFVFYEGKFFFPTYTSMIPGKNFGLDYEYETNYRKLKKHFEKEGGSNFVLMPVIPYGPYEIDLRETEFPPFPPNFQDAHYLGTDAIGRDMIARLIYGYRISMGFAVILLIITYSIGIILGSLMGYWGGKFDLFFQRIIEIWSAVPFLYAIMIISAILIPNFWVFILINVFFGWMGMTWYMRTFTYKEKAREYVLAAKALGASDLRIILVHILPNSLSLLVTFVPFAIASGISALTGLDFLGFGLSPPTPSWGELLQQGLDQRDASWIITSIVTVIVVVLVMITFIGEAIREAFDPKMYTTYE